MAYILERFITTDLPTYEPTTDMSPAGAVDGFVSTISGGYDSAGDDDAAAQLPYTINYRALAYAETLADFRTAIDSYRALVRKSGRLYRRGEDDDSIQWCVARLIQTPTTRATSDKRWMEIEFVFQAKTLWQGADHSVWVLDSGEILDGGLYLDEGGETYTGSSPHIFTATNGGNRVVTDPVITVTAGGASITSVTITKIDSGGSETKIVWTGTLLTTKQLIVDCGKFTITNDGANAYSGKAAFDSNHTIAEWLRIDPGYNEITVTWVGGSTDSTVTLEFRDGWA
jgi:hypothetical protein